MRTRLSVCRRKMRFSSEDEAMAAVREGGNVLRHYRCDRCWQYHLTSRTKGKRPPPPIGVTLESLRHES